jgi:hypothetical protein
MEITHSNARKVVHQLHNLKARLDRVKEASQDAVGRAKMTVEVLGGAGIAGYLNGKLGTATVPTYQLFGFDADMAIGLAGTALAMAGMGGKYDEDLLGLSLGFAASWAAREGQTMGKASLTPATTTTTAGAIPAGQYGGAIPAGQYGGAIPAGQYGGAVPAGAYR